MTTKIPTDDRAPLNLEYLGMRTRRVSKTEDYVEVRPDGSVKLKARKVAIDPTIETDDA